MSVRSVISRRHVIIIGFLGGLLTLEIALGVARLDSLSRSRTQELLGGLGRAHQELAQRIGESLRSGREHARFLVRLPAVRELLGTTLGSVGARDYRNRLKDDLCHYLITFPLIDRLSVEDARGRMRFQLHRVMKRLTEGVGVLPEALSEAAPAEATPTTTAMPSAEITLSGIEEDPERREVPPNKRQILRYRAPVFGAVAGADEVPLGALVLTVYAAPMLEDVRQFAPVDGVVSMLTDGRGWLLAHPNRNVERSILEAVDESRRADRARGARILTDIEGGVPGWRLVLDVPQTALDASVASIRGEYAWIIGSMAVGSVILIAAGAAFLWVTAREVRVREAARHQERQRELERRVQISERLGSLGLLTAGVAHEINNPLEGIENYLTLLERDSADGQKRARYIEMVRYGFRRIRDLVRDLSSFARPDVKSAAAADLATVVERSLGLVRYDRSFREVEVERRGLDRPLWAIGDPGRLEQVFINLFVNAGRAMKGAGKVIVTARETRGASDEPVVEVLVEDTGPGIPADILGRIFDPFFTTGEGSGLGLSITYGIVRAHGGELRAENRAEGGARFVFRLPKTSAETPAALVRSATPPAAKAHTKEEHREQAS